MQDSRHADFLAAQLSRMAANWRQSMSPDEQYEIRQNYAEVLDEIGEAKFTEAVTDAIKYHPTFWPTVAEFRQYIPQAEVIRDRKGCGQCMEGWRFIQSTDSAGNAVKKVTRCNCHPAYRGGAA